MFTILCYYNREEYLFREENEMKFMKKILALSLCLVAFTTMMLFAGCNDEDNSSSARGAYVSEGDTVQQNTDNVENATVSQPQVDTNKFPKDYEDIEQKVYFVIASPKTTKDGKTTGSDALKIMSTANGKVTDELNKKLNKEITSAVNEQIDTVNCTDAHIEEDPNNSKMGLLTVTFTYKSTGGEDKKIFSMSLS